jgi:DNA-binding NarL/FixJ family response regulator
MDKLTVMIIDEQAFFGAGIRQALSQYSDIITLDYDSTQDPFKQIESNPPDIALIGSGPAGLSGLELGRRIVRFYPNTKVILLSPDPSDEEVFQAIKSAAVACLNKNISAEELVECIMRASKGEYPINESLTTRPLVAVLVLREFHKMVSMGKAMESVASPLTQSETEILNYIANGSKNKQIAFILKLSEQTIKKHVSVILRKLNANDRAHAAVLAIRHGWISAEEPAVVAISQIFSRARLN